MHRWFILFFSLETEIAISWVTAQMPPTAVAGPGSRRGHLELQPRTPPPGSSLQPPRVWQGGWEAARDSQSRHATTGQDIWTVSATKLSVCPTSTNFKQEQVCVNNPKKRQLFPLSAHVLTGYAAGTKLHLHLELVRSRRELTKRAQAKAPCHWKRYFFLIFSLYKHHSHRRRGSLGANNWCSSCFPWAPW